mmetsp:Transcript_18390/g.16429  ORF Transcript_18390/g.16429 Transcript_18390/m.16429 type:complete len:179 (-) Transcript_18390:26-562(-)
MVSMILVITQIIIVMINLVSSKKLYTDVDGRKFCLAIGKSPSRPLFEGHSLGNGEFNVYWCDSCSEDQSCSCLDFTFSNGQFYTYKDDKTYYLEWDGDQGDGNEIRSDERNLKLDSGSGDTFYKYSDSYCADVDGHRCCMEWDSDKESFSDTIEQYITCDGREAKVDCDGGKDTVDFE